MPQIYLENGLEISYAPHETLTDDELYRADSCAEARNKTLAFLSHRLD